MKKHTNSEQELREKYVDLIIKVYKLGYYDAIYNASTPIISYVYEIMQLIQSEREKSFAQEKLRLKEVLEQLYEDLNFHHVAKSMFAEGSWDDGVHHAINLVQQEIIRQIKVLVQKESS